MSRKQIKILLTISGIILAFPLILYFSNFNGQLSSDSGKWRDFSNFTILFVTIINMLLIGSISYTTSKTTALFQERQLRPHIYIIEGKTINKDFSFTSRTWQMINSSNVPANNVLVRYSFGCGTMTNWILCFSIGPKDKVELGWISFAETIEVCYADIEGIRFYSYQITNWTGKEMAINKYEFERNMSMALGKKTLGGAIITNNIVEENLITWHKSKGLSVSNTEISNYLLETLRAVSPSIEPAASNTITAQTTSMKG